MNYDLRKLCEQIQEDILTFADSGDYSGFASETLDELCEIVVRNFREFNCSEDYSLISKERSYLIQEIEFDVSGEENEPELQASLQRDWIGQITPPLCEEEVIHYITEKSGWCVMYVRYDTCNSATL